MAAASACGLIAAAQSAGVVGKSAGTNIGIGVGTGKAGGLAVSEFTYKSKLKKSLCEFGASMHAVQGSVKCRKFCFSVFILTILFYK